MLPRDVQVIGFVVIVFGLALEAVAILAVVNYRIRRLLPMSPFVLQGIGAFVFFIGAAIFIFGDSMKD